MIVPVIWFLKPADLRQRAQWHYSGTAKPSVAVFASEMNEDYLSELMVIAVEHLLSMPNIWRDEACARFFEVILRSCRMTATVSLASLPRTSFECSCYPLAVRSSVQHVRVL